MQEGFPEQATGVSALRAAGIRVACRISSGDAARTAIAVALAIGIPEGSQRSEPALREGFPPQATGEPEGSNAEPF
jgi:magnesium-transporting ATPase (P-type)